jgi:general secretion pathway protein J
MRSARGFTLMEVLVALVLLTLFTLVSYRALNAVLDSQRYARAEMAHWRGMAAAFVRVDSDLSNAVTRLDPSDPSGSVFHTRTETDGAMQFDLVRLLPEDADEGVRHVGYRCAQGSLSRMVWPEVADAAAAVQETPLLKGLQSCAFKYLNERGEWLPVWLPQKNQPLPRAVELDLVAADGTPIRRVWRVQ